MKVVVALGLLLLPLLCGAAETSFPTSEGTTWHYELVKEKPSDSVDLSEPNEEERLSVTYRLNAIEKKENKQLLRLEIYRGEEVQNTDEFTIDEQGIACSNAWNDQGAVIKFEPAQKLVALPLTAGTNWSFDGTIGGTEVSQHWSVVGDEEVTVPAGKFQAWRIHCEQLLPGRATIDRWFVPGTGFVKVETIGRGPSGEGILQKTSMNLKAPPKVEPPLRKKSATPFEQFSAGVASEPKGEFKSEFKPDAPAIYAHWRGHGLREQAEIRAVFIAENVADVASDYEIDESSSTAPKADSGATFTLSKPETGWVPGNYRIEFYVDNQRAATVKFKIAK